MKALLLFSGGMDSTYLLHELLRENVGEGKRQVPNTIKEVVCLSFNYGQPHADKELTAAKEITNQLGITHLFEILDFPFLKQDMVGTPVVPNRNMIFLSVAGAVATTQGCEIIFIGCTKSDYQVFPDCRPVFLLPMSEAMTHAIGVSVVAPLVMQTKADIVKGGARHGIDWGQTWSCYAGLDEPCGKCVACVEREKALCES